MKTSPKYSQRDAENLAKFFVPLWCVVVLNPRHQIRGFLRMAGLIEKKGPLVLSASGKRIIKEFNRERAPKE